MRNETLLNEFSIKEEQLKKNFLLQNPYKYNLLLNFDYMEAQNKSLNELRETVLINNSFTTLTDYQWSQFLKWFAKVYNTEIDQLEERKEELKAYFILHARHTPTYIVFEDDIKRKYLPSDSKQTDTYRKHVVFKAYQNGHVFAPTT